MFDCLSSRLDLVSLAHVEYLLCVMHHVLTTICLKHIEDGIYP